MLWSQFVEKTKTQYKTVLKITTKSKHELLDNS